MGETEASLAALETFIDFLSSDSASSADTILDQMSQLADSLGVEMPQATTVVLYSAAPESYGDFFVGGAAVDGFTRLDDTEVGYFLDRATAALTDRIGNAA